jgi:hypothetical protein
MNSLSGRTEAASRKLYRIAPCSVFKKYRRGINVAGRMRSMPAKGEALYPV